MYNLTQPNKNFVHTFICLNLGTNYSYIVNGVSLSLLTIKLTLPHLIVCHSIASNTIELYCMSTQHYRMPFEPIYVLTSHYSYTGNGVSLNMWTIKLTLIVCQIRYEYPALQNTL